MSCTLYCTVVFRRRPAILVGSIVSQAGPSLKFRGTSPKKQRRGMKEPANFSSGNKKLCSYSPIGDLDLETCRSRGSVAVTGKGRLAWHKCKVPSNLLRSCETHLWGHHRTFWIAPRPLRRVPEPFRGRLSKVARNEGGWVTCKQHDAYISTSES